MKDTHNPLKAGHSAEAEACRYLQTHGLRLLEQNYQSYCGEIDLIMQDGDEIVFVEVRVRNNPYYGDAMESVNIPKQKKIFKTAMYYLQTKKWIDKVDARFDVVGVSETNRIEWIKDAFEVDYF